MSYEDKILDKFADMIMPPGTIIAYQGIEAPEGFIVYDHIKIYEDEFPRLYPVLAANRISTRGRILTVVNGLNFLKLMTSVFR